MAEVEGVCAEVVLGTLSRQLVLSLAGLPLAWLPLAWRFMHVDGSLICDNPMIMTVTKERNRNGWRNGS